MNFATFDQPYKDTKTTCHCHRSFVFTIIRTSCDAAYVSVRGYEDKIFMLKIGIECNSAGCRLCLVFTIKTPE